MSSYNRFKKQEVPRVTFLGKILKPTVSAKDLGVHLDPNLTYDHHISTVVSSCLSKLCQINRVKKSFDKTTLELLITALVFSKMFYCSSVWGNTSFLNVNKLQSIQNFACRIITNTRKYDHVTPLLRELNWLPVREQLRYRDTVLVYKCQNGLAPQYLMDKFFKRLCIHNRVLAQRTLYRYRFLEQKQVSVLLSLEEPIYGITWMTTLSNALLSHRLNGHLETRY